VVHSPVTTPVKESTPASECTLEITPVKQISPNELTSPVLTAGKNKRNPFFKQKNSFSPRKDVTGPSPSLFTAGGAQGQKFSALSKFSKLKRTEIDDKTIVQSR